MLKLVPRLSLVSVPAPIDSDKVNENTLSEDLKQRLANYRYNLQSLNHELDHLGECAPPYAEIVHPVGKKPQYRYPHGVYKNGKPRIRARKATSDELKNWNQLTANRDRKRQIVIEIEAINAILQRY